MWLDDLNDLVGTLKERIERHADVLSKNETATRYALIDPLLTALGWDLQNPGQVRIEYDPDGARHRTGYTMFTGDDNPVGTGKKPQLVIEAKKLGTQIGDDVIAQTISYCIREGIPYFVVTNGSEWEIYPTFGGAHVRLTDKRIVDFSLKDPDQATVMKMLFLWRGNFESDSPIAPVVPDRPVSKPTVTPELQPEAAEPTPDVERSDRSIPLHEFNPSKTTPLPASLIFPDGMKKNIAKWYEIQTSVVEWLVGIGRLTDADCPIKRLGGQHLVATSPVEHNGKEFHNYKWVDNVCVNTTKDRSGHVESAREILINRNIDPSRVRVVMGI